ncbi:MAG: hypothetical protein QF473_09290, partial [Planctomycetota bacterium]|nr:hypothetical protein [Planctomycetota bacterium]
DPDFNPNDGWKSDSWQMRIVTDQTLWLTTWHFAAKKMAVLHHATWQDPGNARGGTDEFVLRTKADGSELGRGAAMRYRIDEDGKGCVQEFRIPWKLLYKNVPKLRDGFTFQFGNEFLWGDTTGKTWPIHRYADNFQPGHTSREFYWSNYRVWGAATLVGKGGIEPRKYVSAGSKLEGTIPVRFELPKDAARFTVAIEDEKGNRIRNLAGDLDPADYTVSETANTRTVEVKWDGLTDKVWSGNHREGYKGAGQFVSKGSYKARGLYHKGLGAEYEMCFYNPGTPPWSTSRGNGAWGSDHSPPEDVARSGDWMILSWKVVEGGSGIIGIGPDGKKRWGEKRGGVRITANEKYVYAMAGHTFHSKDFDNLIRLSKKNGAYMPFVQDGKKLPFDLNPADLLPKGIDATVRDIAVTAKLLVLALASNQLAVLDAETAERKKLIEVDTPTRVAFGKDGECFVLSNGKVVRIDISTGKVSDIPVHDVGEAVDIAIDADGLLVVADNGSKQVKAFSIYAEAGLAYACGKRGGRPIRGKFDPQAIVSIKNIDCDAQGNIWVVEDTSLPRRVSVWSKDGKLVRDYIGNTGYSGTCSYLHDSDPTLGFYGPVEMKLDKEKRTCEVTQILWAPDPEVPSEQFPISHHSHNQPTRFTSSASGQPREYVHSPQTWQAVYMPIDGKWQPVAAICHVGNISGKITRHGDVEELPSGEWADLNPKDGLIWSDKNRDGRVERSECIVMKTEFPADPESKDWRKRKGEYALAVRNGWGGRPGSDLSIYASGHKRDIVRYKPAGFTKDGAPVYSNKTMTKVGINEYGDLVPVTEEELLLCLSWKGYGGPTRLLGVNTKDGSVRWRYPNPYPGVHGSHRATMPKPGMLIGPLKTLGVVKVSDEIGRVFAMRGNLGQDFYMTTDGLFVGSLFVDGRLPGESFPDKEEHLVGAPMESFTVGGEPFSGTLVKHTDGVVRTATGQPGQACMVHQVKGLDTIRRFNVGTIAIDDALLARIKADVTARNLATTKPQKKEYTIARAPKDAAADGNLKEWKDVARIRIEREGTPENASIQLMWNDTHLYANFNVSDHSPWKNQGKDFGRLFKTGDAVDIQLSPTANRKRDPVEGDLRLLISQLNKRPVVFLMKPKDATGTGTGKTYSSPVMARNFARVEIVKSAKVRVIKRGDSSYFIEASIPLKAIGLNLKPGQLLRGDVGFISSNAAGTINTARTYWSNQQTNLVNDEPSESWLYPEQWAEIKVK